MKLVPAVVLGLVVLAGCTGAGTDVESQEANTNTTSSTTTTSTTVTSSGSSSVTTTTTGGRPSSSASSTIHTDGGDVTVRAHDGELEVVDVETAPGWRSDHRLETPDRLVVTFERDGSRVEVTVELTATGVVTHTRSVTTG